MTSLSTNVSKPLIKSRALRRFLSHKLALIGLIMVLSLTAACFIGPYLLPYDELHIDLMSRFAPPGTGGHLFGTDPLGRDIAARLFHAGQISMAVGFAFHHILRAVFTTHYLRPKKVCIKPLVSHALLSDAFLCSLRRRDENSGHSLLLL